MATLDQIFANTKLTENGDIAYSSTGKHLLDLLFMSEYYQNHVCEATIGVSDREKLFSMFVRDPRFGLGRRDLGRQLMSLSNVSFEDIVKAGRFDDIYFKSGWEPFLEKEIKAGNQLAKKWAPRYSSSNLMLARQFAKFLGLNKQRYGKFVKCETVEQNLSRKETEKIDFEHVPSLAMIKYMKRFSGKEDTKERFAEYMRKVKSGEAKLHVSTTSVYDIYRAWKNGVITEPDVFFDNIEKIAINCVPVIDSSGSMRNGNDSYGKALAIGHYLAKCSTYAPNKAVSFSSYPQLLTLGEQGKVVYGESRWGQMVQLTEPIDLTGKEGYEREILSLHTDDCTNTDFGAVMNLFQSLTDVPEYLVVLSDMEFDRGSKMSKDQLRALWAQRGYKTKIVWWNLNSTSKTAPEIDADGNIFMSGYNPMLLKFLEADFDGNKMLDKLLLEYGKKVKPTFGD